MDRDALRDSKWRAIAAQLPTRNQHPPGRLPVNSILMRTNNRQTQQTLPGGNSFRYHVNNAVSPDSVAPAAPNAGQKLTVENLALAPVAFGVVSKPKDDKSEVSLRLSSIGRDQVLDIRREGREHADAIQMQDRAGALNDTTNVSIRDIRNGIAPPHKLENVEGTIHKDPWMGEGDDDAHFLCESYNTRFVNAWRSHIPNDIRADFLENGENENHSKHPVNTETGTLMDRIEQPASTRNPEVLTPVMKEHADLWTSNYLVMREIKLREKKRVQRLKREADMSPAPDLDVLEQTAQATVQVNCYLRPAKQDDVGGILDIYNWEIKKGYRACDTSLISNEDVLTIGRKCHKQCLPFIVAVHEPINLSDPAIWPNRAAWEKYMQMPQKPSHEEPRIIGFAFCEGIKVGFGKGSHTGQQSIKLHLYVHHEYRSKNVGSALLDRILTHMSRFYVPDRIKHRWEVIAGSKPYDSPISRNRMIPQRILIEGLFRGEKDPELKYVRKWLESFNFSEVGRVEGAHGTKRGQHNSEWMNMHIWQHTSCGNTYPDGSDPGIWEGGLIERLG
ncbi:hypothetical protein ACHAQA_008086 [Verticillium albo-atrum]